jgi:hypothetical protein
MPTGRVISSSSSETVNLPELCSVASRPDAAQVVVSEKDPLAFAHLSGGGEPLA